MQKAPELAGALRSMMAEEEGFEPSYPGYRVNGFRDRRIQPLCHSSVGVKHGASQGARHEKMLAESQGFEPWRRFWRLHDFQSCSFGHSDNSP